MLNEKYLKMNSNTKFNREFKIVFQPKEKENFNNKRRFAVGAGRLEIYIGKSNAEVVFKKGMELTKDKIRIKFRKHGIVDIYLH